MVKITFAILLSLISAAWAIPTSHEVRSDQSAAVGRAIPVNDISPYHGAVITDTRDSQYRSIEGTITVPAINYPTNLDPDHDTYTTVAWIGLDGFGCEGYLRAGVGMYLTSLGPEYNLQYSFSEVFGAEVSGATISPGDQIRFKVSVGLDPDSPSFSNKKGHVDIDNLTNGESYSEGLAVDSKPGLCLSRANWQIERLGLNFLDNLYPLPDFDQILWSDTFATTISGEKVKPTESHLLDLDDGFTLTKEEVTYDSVTIFYDGT